MLFLELFPSYKIDVDRASRLFALSHLRFHLFCEFVLSRNLRIPNSPCFSSLDGARESLFTLHVACECSLPSNTNDLKFKKRIIRNSNSRMNRIAKSSALLTSVRMASRPPSQGMSPAKPLFAIAAAFGVGYSYTNQDQIKSYFGYGPKVAKFR